MRIVLRLMTCLLIVSFCSVYSMKENFCVVDKKDREEHWFLTESEERYDRVIYKAGVNVWKTWSKQHLRELTNQMLSFYRYNQQQKNERKKLIEIPLIQSAASILSYRWFHAEVKDDPGVGYRFFKAAKKLKPYYKPRKKEVFKLMGGKRFRTVGHGDQIEFFSKACIAFTAIRYNSGSKEDTINKQFKKSRREYVELTKEIKMDAGYWKINRMILADTRRASWERGCLLLLGMK